MHYLQPPQRSILCLEKMMSAILILQLGFTTLFQLFRSCQKVEMKLSKLVAAVECQDFVLALVLFLFLEWNYLIMW